MKKQINPTIKAQILRSAFILLSLVAVCAIPFSLAQRNTTKRSVAKPAAKPNLALVPTATGMQAASPAGRPVSPQLPYDVRNQPNLPRISEVPQTTSGARAAHILPILRPPKAPQVVLYDQYNNASTVATLSGTFTDFPTFSSDLADDFVVPGGQTWNVDSIDADGVYFNGPGPANSWNVFIYTDSSTLPGTQVYSILNTTVTQVGTTFTVNLIPAAVLAAGTYWIEIQANMTFVPNGEWGWTDRTVQANNGAAWQNPGGGFGICPTWTRKLICVPTAGGPDQVYRINGTIGGGGTPSPTPTCSPGEVIVNGGFEAAAFTGWVLDGHVNDPVIATNQVHSGTFSAFAGGNPQQNTYCEENNNEPLGDSSFYQQFTVPAGGGTLSFWHMDCTNDSITFDWQDAYITDSSGNILQTIYHVCDNTAWVNQTVDMAPYAGQTVRIKFLVHQDGFNPPGDTTGQWVDDVSLPAGACGPTPTPTPTATPGGCTINGSIDTGDPIQTGRLFRSGVPQTCPASTTCSTFDTLPHHYDAYTFTNTTGASQCVTIDTNTACTGTNFIFIAAYLGSFDPNNICTNWIGDSGSSPNPDQPFQVTVDNGQTFVVVVNEVTPDAGCPAYTVTITPQSICGGGTPTPTPTCTPGAAKIYNIAGFGLGIQTTTTRIYDIASNTW